MKVELREEGSRLIWEHELEFRTKGDGIWEVRSEGRMKVVRVGWAGEVAARGDGDAAMRRDLGRKSLQLQNSIQSKIKRDEEAFAAWFYSVRVVR